MKLDSKIIEITICSFICLFLGFAINALIPSVYRYDEIEQLQKDDMCKNWGGYDFVSFSSISKMSSISPLTYSITVRCKNGRRVSWDIEESPYKLK